jgi:hypothetical protein
MRKEFGLDTFILYARVPEELTLSCLGKTLHKNIIREWRRSWIEI